MGKSDNLLNELLREVISEGFPELEKIKINISFNPNPDTEETPFGQLKIKGFIINRWYEILIDEILKRPARKVLKGVIAHEVAHVHDYVHSNIFKKLSLVMILFSHEYTTKRERDTDMLVIDRGFGEELHAFVKYSDRRYDAYEKEDGLTQKEVKKLLK